MRWDLQKTNLEWNLSVMFWPAKIKQIRSKSHENESFAPFKFLGNMRAFTALPENFIVSVFQDSKDTNFLCDIFLSYLCVWTWKHITYLFMSASGNSHMVKQVDTRRKKTLDARRTAMSGMSHTFCKMIVSTVNFVRKTNSCSCTFKKRINVTRVGNLLLY